MRVLNVNSSLDFKVGGGTAERTFQVSRFLAREGIKCTVLTIDAGLDKARILTLKPAELIAIPSLWKRFYVPRISWKVIREQVDKADVIHLMGHWGVLNALVYIATRRAGKPYVVCPAGALPLFGRSRWLKILYNLIIGNAIIRNASGWIAITSAEFPHFVKYGIPSSRVSVIPNGVSEEDFSRADIELFRRQSGLPDAPIILFMGRLNPIKGPDLLLHAFVLIKGRIGNYHLVFAGPDEGMQATLQEVAKREGISERVHFLGFVKGDDKSAAYQLASLLVIPSRQEAMSIVALEGGICGTPTMLTDQCGFGEIQTIDPGLEVPATVTDIADGLLRLTTNPGLLHRIGPAFRDFVLRQYTWRSVVTKYLHLYKNIMAMSSGK